MNIRLVILALISTFFLTVTTNTIQAKSFESHHCIGDEDEGVIEVKHVYRTMSKGGQPGWQVDVPGAKTSKVSKEWAKLMKSYDGKVSTIKKPSKESYTVGTIIKSISETSIETYATFEKFKDGTRMTVFVDKDGEFIGEDSREEEIKAVKNFLYGFAVEEAQSIIDSEIKDAEKDFSKLESQLKKLQKEHVKLNESIVDNEQAIVDNEKNITDSTSEIAVVEEEIASAKTSMEEQQTAVDAIEDTEGDEYKAQAKELKSRTNALSKAENKLQRLQKSIERSTQTIAKANEDITKAKKRIPENEKEQSGVEMELSNQKKVIDKIYDKKDAIK